MAESYRSKFEDIPADRIPAADCIGGDHTYSASFDFSIDADAARSLNRWLEAQQMMFTFRQAVEVLEAHVPRDVPHCVIGQSHAPGVLIVYFLAPVSAEQWARTEHALYPFLPIVLALEYLVREPRCTIHEDCVRYHDLGRECLERSHG